MPLKSGYSHATFSANLAELIRAGHERNAAIMAAASNARKCFFNRFPKGALPLWMAFPKQNRMAAHYDSGGRPLIGTYQHLYSLKKNPREESVNLDYLASASIPYGGRAGDRRAMERQKSKIVAGLVSAGYTASLAKRIVDSAQARQASENRGGTMMFIQDNYLRDSIPQRNPRSGPDQASLSKATALYEGFTGKAPRRVHRLNVPALPKAALAIGKVFGIMYSVDATGERFHHEFKSKAQPLLIVSPDGQQVFLHGGAFTFTKRGFVDH